MIRHSSITNNSLRSTNTAGDANGFGGGIGVDGALVLAHSTVDHNHLLVTVPAGSSAGANSDSAGIGMGGYAAISHSQITANSVTVHAPGGTASAMFAALSAGNGTHTTTISHSTISGNRLHATTRTGSVVIQGAGIGHLNGGPLVLRDSTITRNHAAGTGPGGMAQGGGIWNGSLDPSSSLGPLRIIDTSITRNVLGVSAGITTQGAGLFTAARPTIRHSTILGNAPDQCLGC